MCCSSTDGQAALGILEAVTELEKQGEGLSQLANLVWKSHNVAMILFMLNHCDLNSSF